MNEKSKKSDIEKIKKRQFMSPQDGSEHDFDDRITGGTSYDDYAEQNKQQPTDKPSNGIDETKTQQ